MNEHKTSAALTVTDLDVTFLNDGGSVHAVRGLSFSVPAGRTVALVGESASGKTATSLALMGLTPRRTRVSGSVRLGEQELVGASDAAMSKVRGKDIAMVFQDPQSALTPVLTVGQQLIEAVRTHKPGLSTPRATQLAIETLELVGIARPDLRVSSYPSELSGGTLQRVLIAMAIINRPRVLIADEPTTALDVTVRAHVLDVLSIVQQETGAGLVLVTHDLGVVAGMADEVLVMYSGRVVERGSASAVFDNPRMPYTIGLLGAVPRLDRDPGRRLVAIGGSAPPAGDAIRGCSFAPRCPLATEQCRAVEPLLSPVDGGLHAAACHRIDHIRHSDLTADTLFSGRPAVRHQLAAVPRTERASVLTLEGVKRHFPLRQGTIIRRTVGTVRAVDGIDLDVRQSETVGLVGESGSGKTTTVLEIMNLLPPTDGRIVVLGSDVATLDASRRRSLRRDLQVVFQDPLASVDPRMPLFEIVSEPLRAFGHTRAHMASRVDELLSLVGLEDDLVWRFPHALSGGQLQRVSIARALALEPKVIVLDEPLTALDVSIQAGIVNLLEDLQGRLGVAYLFVAHDLPVIRHIADRVAVMYGGRIVEEGPTARVYDRPGHPYTAALLSAVPIPDPAAERRRNRTLLIGEQPSPLGQSAGCTFRPRCPLWNELDSARQGQCAQVAPALAPVTAQADHSSACHFGDLVTARAQRTGSDSL